MVIFNIHKTTKSSFSSRQQTRVRTPDGVRPVARHQARSPPPTSTTTTVARPPARASGSQVAGDPSHEPSRHRALAGPSSASSVRVRLPEVCPRAQPPPRPSSPELRLAQPRAARRSSASRHRVQLAGALPRAATPQLDRAPPLPPRPSSTELCLAPPRPA